MQKQALVIGLGQFGFAMAKSLSQKGFEVIAVDNQADRLERASAFAQTRQMDATDKDALNEVSPQTRDVCVCGIGDVDREASIICTALLNELGAQHIIARANDDVHARILGLVGASEVVNPEKEFGEQYVLRLASKQVLSEVRLGSGLVLVELKVPGALSNKTLKQLELPTKHKIQLVAIKVAGEAEVSTPNADTMLHSLDIMFIVGSRSNVDKFLRTLL